MCICKTSLPHRPDGYIGFTSSCPSTFYNKIAPMVTAVTHTKRVNRSLLRNKETSFVCYTSSVLRKKSTIETNRKTHCC